MIDANTIYSQIVSKIQAKIPYDIQITPNSSNTQSTTSTTSTGNTFYDVMLSLMDKEESSELISKLNDTDTDSSNSSDLLTKYLKSNLTTSSSSTSELESLLSSLLDDSDDVSISDLF